MPASTLLLRVDARLMSEGVVVNSEPVSDDMRYIPPKRSAGVTTNRQESASALGRSTPQAMLDV